MPRIASFSFAQGQEAQMGDFRIYDCRALPDPEGQGIGENGTDPAIQDWIRQNSVMAVKYLMAAHNDLKSGFNVAFGCYAGKNRSVALACLLYERASQEGLDVDLTHYGKGLFW